MPKPLPENFLARLTNYSDVKVVGIPRALLYWRYETLFLAFFDQLGCTCVVSPETDKAICDEGCFKSVDECCLASKIYMGHVAALKGKCDAVFVPRIADYGERKVFCTKFHALPDLVENTFYNEGIRILPMSISKLKDNSAKKAFIELGVSLGHTPPVAAKAYAIAKKEQRKHEEFLWKRQREALAQPGRKVLLMAHPYVSHDSYLGGDIVRMVEKFGAQVIFADETNRKATFKRSFELSDTMPWIVSRELYGSALMLEDQIDGIILATSFPCGPDSMANDLFVRKFTKVPILQLTLDAQSGTAGLETRIESFLDILEFKEQQELIDSSGNGSSILAANDLSDKEEGAR